MLCPADVWHLYNDHRVSLVSQETVASAQAYLLVYERVDSRRGTMRLNADDDDDVTIAAASATEAVAIDS